MSPRRRSRPRRTRSRGSGSLGYLLLVVLVIGVGWLLVERGAPPGSPGEAQRPPRADGPADNRAAIRRLGGTVDYGRVDPATGQRSGVTATVTAAMVEAAAEDELGSAADPDIRPPGFDRLPARNRARGHLLGRQLGGSGDLEANLVALYQARANSPVMRDYEGAVADAAQAGETIQYTIRPLYGSRTSNGAPRAIRITAAGDGGFRLDVTVANTPQATVKEAVPPPAGP